MTDDRLSWFEDRLDRLGADLSDWPDQAAAQAARRLVLSSPEARARWEAAGAVDAGLERLAAGLDAGIAAAGGIDRIGAAVAAIPALDPRRSERLPVRAVALYMAAAWLAGVALGAAVPAGAVADGQDILPDEALIFGPEELDLS